MSDEEQKHCLMLNELDYICSNQETIKSQVLRLCDDFDIVEFFSFPLGDKDEKRIFFVVDKTDNKSEGQLLLIHYLKGSNQFKLWCFPLFFEMLKGVREIISLTGWDAEFIYNEINNCTDQNKFKSHYENCETIYTVELDRFAVVQRKT